MGRTVRRAVTPQTENSQSETQGDYIASVPERRYLDEYVNRKVSGKTDFEIYDFALDNKLNVLIEGDTGTGKTSSVLAYAAHKGMPFYSVSSSRASDPTQLFGKYIPNGTSDVDGEPLFVWQDGPVTQLVRNGGILLINEINFLPDGIASVLFGLLDKRRKIELVDHKGEVIYAPDDFIVFADYNEGDSYHGTRPLNVALENRFALRLVFEYDNDIEARLVKSSALRGVAAQLRVQVKKGEFDTPISTNALVEFEKVAFSMGVPFAVANFTNKFHARVRPAIKQVFDTWNANLVADFTELNATKESWGNDDLDWQYSDDNFTYSKGS